MRKEERKEERKEPGSMPAVGSSRITILEFPINEIATDNFLMSRTGCKHIPVQNINTRRQLGYPSTKYAVKKDIPVRNMQLRRISQYKIFSQEGYFSTIYSVRKDVPTKYSVRKDIPSTKYSVRKDIPVQIFS